MKPINTRYSTHYSLVLALLSIVGSLFLLTACQGSDSFRPTSPEISVSQGKVYVQYTSMSEGTDDYDTVAVFRADTGRFLWKSSDFIDAPVADSTTVYIPTETSLIAKDAESGKELWHSAGAMIPAAVINGILYARSGLNSSSATFSALQTSDGSQLWSVPFSDSYVKRLEVEQGQLYLLTDNSFSVLQAETGKRLWSVTGTGSGSAFTRGNGMIYLSRDTDHTLLALQENTGKVLWTFHATRILRDSVLTADGILCVNAADAVYGLRAKDGKQLWHLAGKSIGEFLSDLSTANGVLYIPSLNEGLMAVQAQTGQERWLFNPGGPILEAHLDAKSGVIYALVDPDGPLYFAAVRTDGSLLQKTPVQTSNDRYEAGGVVYQVVAGGIVGATNEKQHYTQMDITATNGTDGSSLWSTHFQI